MYNDPMGNGISGASRRPVAAPIKYLYLASKMVISKSTLSPRSLYTCGTAKFFQRTDVRNMQRNIYNLIYAMYNKNNLEQN
jgi:hypothetical protein